MQAEVPTFTKQCPQCQMEFTTPTHDKQYCSVRCRNAAHRIKERMKEVAARRTPTANEVEMTMYFMQPIYDPTEETIVKTADFLVAAKANKPVLFRGENIQKPVVALPPDITFGETRKKGEWLMFYGD